MTPLPALVTALVLAAVPAQPSGEYHAELSNAGVSLVYRVAPTELTVAQRVQVEFTVTAPPGWSVAWPAVGEKLGRMSVVNTADTREGAKQTRTLTLEPDLPGEDTVPALSVSVSPRDPQSGAAPVTLTTEPVKLTLRALLAETDSEIPENLKFRDARGEGDGSGGLTPRQIGALAALGLAVAGGVVALVTRRKTPSPDFAALALARVDAIAAAPASGSSREANEALDALGHASREFLQARGVPDAVGAVTPELEPRLMRVREIAPSAPRIRALLDAIDAARFDPRQQAQAPRTIAAELAAVFRAIPLPAPPGEGGRA